MSVQKHAPFLLARSWTSESAPSRTTCGTARTARAARELGQQGVAALAFVLELNSKLGRVRASPGVDGDARDEEAREAEDADEHELGEHHGGGGVLGRYSAHEADALADDLRGREAKVRPAVGDAREK